MVDRIDEAKKYLYEKKYRCVVCGKDFKDITTRPSKLRFIRSERDLRARYEPVDPLCYDIITCLHCGYAALSKFFDKISQAGKQNILTQITPMFHPRNPRWLPSMEEVVEKYQWALQCAISKQAKASEVSMIFLKMGWAYRELGLHDEERDCMQKALAGFEDAYMQEAFPIAGMNENTYAYLLAVLHNDVGDVSKGKRWLGSVITSRSASNKLKQRSLELKESLK